MKYRLEIIKHNGKCNYKKENSELVSKIWFDNCQEFTNNWGVVKLNGKGYNYINYNGELLLDKWMHYVWAFSYGRGLIQEVRDRYNYVDTKGKILFDKCFVRIYDGARGKYPIVKLENGKWNIINYKNEFVYDKWFKDIEYYGDEKFRFRLVSNKDECFLGDKNGNVKYVIDITPDNAPWYKHVYK